MINFVSIFVLSLAGMKAFILVLNLGEIYPNFFQKFVLTFFTRFELFFVKCFKTLHLVNLIT